MKTELQLDDTAFTASIATIYRFDQDFGVAVPVEMREEYLERGGQRTRGTATYGRFRRFAVETTDKMVPSR